eukprot:scaffold11294_cov117-Isochrysis_galbana.AAC.3
MQIGGGKESTCVSGSLHTGGGGGLAGAETQGSWGVAKGKATVPAHLSFRQRALVPDKQSLEPRPRVSFFPLQHRQHLGAPKIGSAHRALRLLHI